MVIKRQCGKVGLSEYFSRVKISLLKQPIRAQHRQAGARRAIMNIYQWYRKDMALPVR